MSGGAKCSPHSSSARSSAARTSSSPRASARANGPGTMPTPSMSPRSISRTPAMPSSSTRQASTKAFSPYRSTIRSSSPGSAVSAVLIEPLPGLRPEVAAVHELLHPAVHVEPVAVGLLHVLRDLEGGVEPRHVHHLERPHGQLRLLLDE